MANNTKRISPRYAATMKAVEVTLDHHGFAMFRNATHLRILGLDMNFRQTETGWKVNCGNIWISMLSRENRYERVLDSSDHGISITVTLIRRPIGDRFSYYLVEKVEMLCTCTSCGGSGGDGYHWIEMGGVCKTCENTGLEHYVLTDEKGAFSGRFPCATCSGVGATTFGTYQQQCDDCSGTGHTLVTQPA